jgi:hypothetical protein
MRCVLAAVMVVLASGACSSGPGEFEYPLDETLRFNHLQAKGTHNSYHVAPDPLELAEWNYTHAPLDVQLGDQGVRQFELDLNVNVFDDRFEVFHFINVDDTTTCFLFVDCLRDLKSWSDDNPAHHPIVIMLELKDPFDAGYAEHFFALFESELLSVWPEDRLVTPDLVRGDYGSLREAVAAEGWPTLATLRGRALFFFLDTAEHRSFYTHGDTSLDGRPAFVVADLDQPYAAVTKMDNPIAGATQIAEAAAAGLLIRTRVDDLGDDGPVIDEQRLAAALPSAAHFLSTDSPTLLALPDGAPSRCNPVTAPAECTSLAIEDPQFID